MERRALARYLRLALGVAAASLISSGPALAHGGGLDGYGCHNDRKRGGYHCHRGPLAGQSFNSQSDMLDALGADRKTPGRTGSPSLRLTPEDPRDRGDDVECPCGSGSVCVGPRGGRFCITSSGKKRYGQ